MLVVCKRNQKNLHYNATEDQGREYNHIKTTHPNQKPSKLFCGYQQTFKVYMEKQKSQNSQHDTEEAEQSQNAT